MTAGGQIRYNKEINAERKMPLNKDCSYHFYWILTKNRNQFRKKMLENGIETGTHYKPIHKMSMYSDNVKLPITEQISQQIVTLPTHPNLTEENINKSSEYLFKIREKISYELFIINFKSIIKSIL